MKKFLWRLSAIGLLFSVSAAFAQNPADPSSHPETIVVTASAIETTSTGANVTTKHVDGTVFQKPHDKSVVNERMQTHYVLSATIGDVRYTLRGGPGVGLGTFKAKITNGMYVDILTEEPTGRRYNTGFEIVSKEKVSVAQMNEEGRFMTIDERKYTARDLYIASAVGEIFTKLQAGTRDESWKKAVVMSRNNAQDPVKVADFEKQFNAAMKALDVEEGRATH